MMDLFGPFRSFVPGFERATRGRRELESKVHILASVCVTTRAVNLQALEGKDSVAIAEGFTRLSSEVGIPTKVLVDQDSGAMAAFKSAEFDYLNFQLLLQTQYGVSFETCPTGGHDQHGLVEAIIKSIQDIFNECDLKTKRLNSLGWQTFCKLAENSFNNLPLGFSYGRQQDNTELLKIITPNMLRIGRNNNRALQGPIRLPGNTKELLDLVDSTYKAWFNVFKETVVPRLIPQPKWFQKEVDLNEEDVVYFRKEEKELNSELRLGTIEQVIRSRDGIIRRIIIKYFNASENDPAMATYRPRFTDRSVRGVVKLWSVDESFLAEDLLEVEKRLKDSGKVFSSLTKQSSTVDEKDQDVALFSYSACQLDSVVRSIIVKDFEEEADDSVDMSSLHSIISSTDFILD